MLQCADGSYYIGVTNDIERRLREHEAGINRNCYTYTRRPLKIVFYEIFNDPDSAIAFEKKIKGWSRKKRGIDRKRISFVTGIIEVKIRAGSSTSSD